MNDSIEKMRDDTRSPMAIFLEQLLGASGDSSGVPAQVTFRWENGMHAGMLSRTRVPGIYSLVTEATTAKDSPHGAGTKILVEQLFQADVVARVMMASEKPEPLITVPS